MDLIVNPMITLLLVLYHLLGQNIFLAIVAFTIVMRLLILPLTLRQQRSMKNMQALAPQLRELQKKYKDDRERLVQEQMKLYREHGVNPMASCLPLLIQLPILFGLWRAILATLASTPHSLLDLEHRILLRGVWENMFGFNVESLIPLQSNWLWLNLAVPDPYFVLPVLVVISSYLQQKLLMPLASPSTGADPNDPAEQAARMTRTLTNYMPLIIGFFALTYSSGLSIYFVVSNIIGIIQYSLMGKADFRRLVGKEAPKKEETPSEGTAVEGESVAVAASSVPVRRLKAGITETRLAPNPGTRKSTPAATRQRPARETINARKPLPSGKRSSASRQPGGGKSTSKGSPGKKK